MKWQVLVSFAYLSDDERVLYSDASFETVITCWDTQETQYSSSSMGTIDISLPFAHPTAAIFVVAQSQHNLIASTTQGAYSATTQHRLGITNWYRAVVPPPVQNPLFAISDAESAFESNAESDAESDFDRIFKIFRKSLNQLNQRTYNFVKRLCGTRSGTGR